MPTESLCELIDRLFREARARAGLAQAELAAQLGVHIDTVKSWERGRREPSLTPAARIAAALGCTLDELVGLSLARKSK